MSTAVTYTRTMPDNNMMHIKLHVDDNNDSENREAGKSAPP
jgi:hypothetical protein